MSTGLFLTGSLVALLTFGCQTFPDPPPGWTGDFTTETVLARAVEVAGAADPGLVADDYIADIEMDRPAASDESVSFVALWKKPGYWRIDRTLPDGESSRLVFDGTTCAEMTGEEVVRRDRALEEIGERLIRLLFVLNYFAFGPGQPAEIVAVVEGPGGTEIVLAKTDPRQQVWLLALDAESLEPIRMQERVPDGAGGSVAVNTFFEEFGPSELGGRQPRLMRTFAGDVLLEQMRVKRIRWNQGLRSQDFAIPAGVSTAEGG